MKIIFLGNFESAFSSENYYLKTFNKLGHEVITLQEGKTTGLEILAHENVDLFFWVKTHSWKTPGIEIALEKLKERGVVSFGYHLDLYVGLQRWKEYENSDYFKVDHFFTVDRYMAEWLNSNTTTKGHYLPPGVYEDECFEGTPNHEKYPHQIIFTGSKGYHPEFPYRPKLINWLHKTYGNMFAHYGGGGLPSVRGPELNNLYASAKIVVGDTLCKGFDYGYYFSDRLTEVTGRCGFMIFPMINGLEFMFEIGKEIVTYKYGDFDQLSSLINYYLQNDAERESIRLAGHKRAKATHTYTHRLKQLLETLEKEKATI